MAHRLYLLAPALAALLAATPALGADYLRQGFAPGWEPEEEDSLTFEIGTRYWYSLGAQTMAGGFGDFTSSDQAHSVEAHGRIDDSYTNTFLKGVAGYSAALSGNYSTVYSSGSFVDGHVGYAGGDFGWYVYGEPEQGFAIGPIAGYHYWNEGSDTGRVDFANIGSVGDVTWSPDTGNWSVGFDSTDSNINISALRLGVAAKSELSDMFDISAEVAAIPYAWVSGTVGTDGPEPDYPPYLPCETVPPGSCDPVNFKTSTTSVNGFGFGGMGEIMLGFHPTENLTIRLGGRAWYVAGAVDASWTGASVSAPQRQPQVPDLSTDDPNDMVDPDPLYGAPVVMSEDFNTTNNPFSMLRYGALLELTYAF